MLLQVPNQVWPVETDASEEGWSLMTAGLDELTPVPPVPWDARRKTGGFEGDMP